MKIFAWQKFCQAQLFGGINFRQYGKGRHILCIKVSPMGANGETGKNFFLPKIFTYTVFLTLATTQTTFLSALYLTALGTLLTYYGGALELYRLAQPLYPYYYGPIESSALQFSGAIIATIFWVCVINNNYWNFGEGFVWWFGENLLAPFTLYILNTHPRLHWHVYHISTNVKEILSLAVFVGGIAWKCGEITRATSCHRAPRLHEKCHQTVFLDSYYGVVTDSDKLSIDWTTVVHVPQD